MRDTHTHATQAIGRHASDPAAVALLEAHRIAEAMAPRVVGPRHARDAASAAVEAMMRGTSRNARAAVAPVATDDDRRHRAAAIRALLATAGRDLRRADDRNGTAVGTALDVERARVGADVGSADDVDRNDRRRMDRETLRMATADAAVGAPTSLAYVPVYAATGRRVGDKAGRAIVAAVLQEWRAGAIDAAERDTQLARVGIAIVARLHTETPTGRRVLVNVDGYRVGTDGKTRHPESQADRLDDRTLDALSTRVPKRARRAVPVLAPVTRRPDAFGLLRLVRIMAEREPRLMRRAWEAGETERRRVAVPRSDRRRLAALARDVDKAERLGVLD